MTRILYWNINNFSVPKIWVAAPPVAAAEAFQRRNYIVNQIMAAPAAGGMPDVIIVVEVYSRIREVGLEGTVLNSGRSAGLGCLQLLLSIQANLGAQWCLVPPLNLGELGQREAVAVFYNSNNLQFTGPNLYYRRWPGSTIGQAQPVTPLTFANIINYPLTWQNGLPIGLGRNWAFPGIPAPINEWQLAGQWEYYTTPPPRPIPSPIQPPYPLNRIFFPNAGCRAPFWTRFEDLTAMLPRTLNLFTVHTSPSSARQAIIQMQNIVEMTAVGANEVNVILGDFNVDAFGANAGAYNWMILPPGPGVYTMELDPRVAHAGPVVAVRKPYCMTHLLPTNSARPFNNTGGVTDPQHNVYPRYGYMGSSFPGINDSGAIDNFFTAYGGGNAVGPAANITVINTITGKPYNAFAAPPNVTAELTGGLAYAASLVNPMPLALAPGGVNPPVDTINFPGWQNFGKIHSTSDHLPLMIDI
jgi:hypothetical protein